jgi:hypothetical protein
MNPHDLHAFVESRIQRGAMLPQANGRFAKIFKGAPRHEMTAAAPMQNLPDRPHLSTRSVGFGRAAAYVALWHRHLGRPTGHIFSMGLFHEGVLCGVAIAGRPVSRMLDNGTTLEITRVATNGIRNGCSKLLAAIRKEARNQGFTRIITYTLPSEGGASLRAAGFTDEGVAGGGSWSRVDRVRSDLQPMEKKTRWAFYIESKWTLLKPTEKESPQSA